MIHGILIKNGTFQVKDIENGLESYYKELECGTIDIVTRHIGNKQFDVVCDDEGLYNDGYISMMAAGAESPMLVGNLFICDHNDKGELISLTDEDCAHIKRFWKFHTLWGSV